MFHDLPYLRILALADPTNDGSVQQRLLQTIFALKTIKENPFFGSYGSYVDASSIGEYSHNLLGLWVNAGLVGVLFYLILFTMILWEVFKVKLTSQNYTLICLSGALGLSAIVAHLSAYVYVEVLLAAAIGSIAKMKEMTDRGQSTLVNGVGIGES
jgi:O-antigen ligase